MDFEKLAESFTGMLREKAEYKAYRNMVVALPNDYQYVAKEIEKYMLNTVGDAEVMPVLMNTIEAFTVKSQNGGNVLDITGKDVGSFCDSLIKQANIRTLAERQNNKYIAVWIEEQKDKLNANIQKKFGAN